MALALSKTTIESQLTTRFGDIFKLNEQRFAAVISTGVPEVDSVTGGLPRGAITEVFGPASSGRTSLMLSTLAHAANHEEVCALVDTNNAFDPKSAAAAGMDLDQLLWIRCDGTLEHAFKAADLLLQGGGFGIVALDIGDIPSIQARRIISSWWYRFRRIVENKPTALVVIAQDSCVRSCASLALEMKKELSVWASATSVIDHLDHYQPYKPVILSASGFRIERQRPIGLRAAEVWAYANSHLRKQILPKEKSLRLA